MLLGLITGALIVFIFVILVSRKKNEIKALKNKETQTENNEEEIKNFEDDFFEATQAGEKSQLFLSLASQKDSAIIRSMLQADKIPSYTEGENMNNIYGGISGTMHAVVAIKIYILQKDYDRACEILEDYLKGTGITVFEKEE